MNKILVAGVLLLLCLSLAACSGSLFRNYGRIDPSNEATRAFETYRVDDNLRYYISGADLYPNALMGLHRNQRLNPGTLWKPVEMTREKMREIVYHMKAKAAEYSQRPYGFDVIDNRGETIGLWYSLLTARTYIRLEEDGTVTIDTPELETYLKMEQAEEM